MRGKGTGGGKKKTTPLRWGVLPRKNKRQWKKKKMSKNVNPALKKGKEEGAGS